MKRIPFPVLIVLCFLASTPLCAQSLDHDLDYEELTEEYGEIEEVFDRNFLIADHKITIVFEEDSNGRAIAEEIHEMVILPLLDYADFFIYLYEYQNEEIDELYFSNSQFKLRDPAAVLVSPIENASIFHHDGKRYKVVKGDLEKGEPIYLTYTKRYKDLRYLTTLYPQEIYFQHQGELMVVIPDWLNLELVEKNLEQWNIGSSSSKEGPYRVQQYTFDKLGFYPDEPHAPGPSYYLPHLLFWFKSTNLNKPSLVFSALDDLYGWYHGLVTDIQEEPDFLIAQDEEIIEGADSDKEKIERIFYWIQNNVRYIAFEDGIAGYQPEAASAVCKNRYGDCKGMANLAKAFYTMAGFDARLSWLGTRRLDYGYQVPSLAVDNHMICTVFHDGERYFIDPTEEFVALGDYAHRIQGRQVLIENGESFILDTIPEQDASFNRLTIKQQYELNGLKLKGHSKRTYKGESKRNFLRAINAIEKEDRQKALQEYAIDNLRMEVNNLQSSNISKRADDLNFEFDFILDDGVVSYKSSLLVDLDHEGHFYYNEIDTNRKSDYHFNHKYDILLEADFQIPAGYTLEHLPESLHKENEFYLMSFEMKDEGEKVHMRKHIKVKKGFIPRSYFSSWNEDLSLARKFYDDRLIISKNK